MNFTSVGDLAQNLMLRRQGAGLKTDLTRLTQELTTGKRQDISSHVGGDFSALGSLKAAVRRLDAFSQARADFGIRLDATQTSLGSLQVAVSNYGTDILAASSLEQRDGLEAHAATAFSRLDQAVSYLNTQSAGRYLFSGTDSAQRPLASADDIMAALRPIASTATDVSDLNSMIDDWFFTPGAGFETAAYGGGSEVVKNVAISEQRKLDLPIKADDTVFRQMLRDLAMTALVAEDASVLSPSDERAVLAQVGENLIAVEDDLTALQRDIGLSQGVLEQEGVAADVERNSISLAVSEIENVDQFETASALEAVQYQIETLYVLTARTSQLRLTDFLR
ncbi:flagellar hook-associated protein 3 FlgL [Litoreibacter ponti]|uniref:Flagellar hook-associated protein 3 FlgL n=1 Tax=Litoreibacter ponti TaxID=1510457 RepID=A0A2T6BNE8_9RHOB|nr:flagellin [Litoreibacter ponti]PTX57599.1 flagellar hook-associated protein 3 FlgL [Litoreibacter ponti]